jgi:hypothetical protein
MRLAYYKSIDFHPKGDMCPATVWCAADKALLCASCDERIHSENKLTARHVRVPINERSLADRNLPALGRGQMWDPVRGEIRQVSLDHDHEVSREDVDNVKEDETLMPVGEAYRYKNPLSHSLSKKSCKF